jgi:hypothetical protein
MIQRIEAAHCRGIRFSAQKFKIEKLNSERKYEYHLNEVKIKGFGTDSATQDVTNQ